MILPKRLNYLARKLLDTKYQRVLAAQAAAQQEVSEYMELRESYGLPPGVTVAISDVDNSVSLPEEEPDAPADPD